MTSVCVYYSITNLQQNIPFTSTEVDVAHWLQWVQSKIHIPVHKQLPVEKSVILDTKHNRGYYDIMAIYVHNMS